MAKVGKWETFGCHECGSKTFVDAHEFIKHPNHGVAKRPLGLICLSCQTPQDSEKMVKVVSRAEKMDRIKELQRELDSELDEGLTDISEAAIKEMETPK